MEDYAKLGLKIGFELHQQLDTKKLFCQCPSELSDAPKEEFKRYLRPTQSELGEIDKAALETASKNLVFLYQAPPTTCLVEADEEPPHMPNKDAIEIAIRIAAMLNAKIVDEFQFMRKIVIDGSNTSGFQRTALIGLDGYVDFKGSLIKIPTICIEEDAARKIETKGTEVTYRLDRLGIPLIEVATAPAYLSPTDAKELAEYIGRIFRATKRVRRGIGTIREDLNISIREGARVEIKGIQELNLIPDYVEKEVKRQLGLIYVRDELKRKGITELEFEVKDLTHIFLNTNSTLFKKFLSNKFKIMGIKLQSYHNLLKILGKELVAHAKIAGVGGIIHSDEISKYGVGEDEIKAIRSALEADENCGFVLVAEEEKKAMKALELVFKRAALAINGVPEETRDPQPDGTTAYSRPLPGSGRMYPETDIPPVRIEKERLKSIITNLPELLDKKMERFVTKYGINKEQASQLISTDKYDIFEELALKYNSAAVIARTLLNTIPELVAEGIDEKKITPGMLHSVFTEFKKNRFSKEAIQQILKYLACNPAKTVEDALQACGLTQYSLQEIEKLIENILQQKAELIEKKGAAALSPIMGVVMKELRGKVDGKTVAEILNKKLKEYIKKSTG